MTVNRFACSSFLLILYVVVNIRFFYETWSFSIYCKVLKQRSTCILKMNSQVSDGGQRRQSLNAVFLPYTCNNIKECEHQ